MKRMVGKAIALSMTRIFSQYWRSRKMEQVNEEYQEEVQEMIEEAPERPLVEPEIERRAEMMGWVPKEKFRGNPDGWIDAARFVQRAEQIEPIFQVQLKKYETTIDGLRTELQSSKETMKKLVKMSETIGQREYERAKQDLIKQQMNAVQEGNTEEWARLEGEKEKLEKPEEIKFDDAQHQTQDINNPIFKEWHSENDWYLKDEDATIYANAVGQRIQDPSIPYPEWLKRVENAVKKAFPHKFENPRRNTAPSVDSSVQAAGVNPNQSKKKTYNDLPADAKAQCNKFVEKGILTKEQYIKDYFEEE
jgi:hypothetical protein